jgi:hypothetical protein
MPVCSNEYLSLNQYYSKLCYYVLSRIEGCVVTDSTDLNVWVVYQSKVQYLQGEWNSSIGQATCIHLIVVCTYRCSLW